MFNVFMRRLPFALLLFAILAALACGSGPPPSSEPSVPPPVVTISAPSSSPVPDPTTAASPSASLAPTLTAVPSSGSLAAPGPDAPTPAVTVAPGPTLVVPGVVQHDSLVSAPAAVLQAASGSARSEGSPAGPAGPAVNPSAGGTHNPNDQLLPLMFFEGHGVNPFVDADEDSLSTFSLDGDTASFELARLYLESGSLPPPDSVRVEEWLNANVERSAGPVSGLGLSIDGGPSLFGPEGYRMVSVTVTPASAPETRDPVSVVFILDTSGSMASDDRMATAVALIQGLSAALQPDDRVALILYGTESVVSLPFVSATRARQSLAQLGEVEPGGSTNVSDAIHDAYSLAETEHEAHPQRSVRFVLLSDGVGNVGATGPDSILARIDLETARSTSLSAIGVGQTGNYNDVLLEALANRGNGTYHYVRDRSAVASFIADRSDSLLVDVARDARVQVEFNPAAVRKYRLLGFENRAVADDDFRDDSLDFGEVGFARPVVALYEIRPSDGWSEAGHVVEARLRWLDPSTSQVMERSVELSVADVGVEPSGSLASVQVIAHVAELLRRSYWAQCSDFGAVSTAMDTLTPDALSALHPSFSGLVETAGGLFVPYCNP